MSQFFNVAKGRQVRLFKNGLQVVDVPLYLEEGLTFNASSQYDTPFGGQSAGSNLVTNALSFVNEGSWIDRTLGRIGADISSGQNKYFYFSTWVGADPISLSLTFNFYHGITGDYNAKTEVYDPIMTLVKLTLPSEGPNGSLKPVGPTVADAVKMWSQDADVELAQVGSTEDSDIANEITEGSVEQSGQARERDRGVRRLSIEIGNILRLPNIIVEKVQPSFSSEVAEVVNGNNGVEYYPVNGSVTMDIQTVTSATVELLETSSEEFSNEGNIGEGKTLF